MYSQADMCTGIYFFYRGKTNKRERNVNMKGNNIIKINKRMEYIKRKIGIYIKKNRNVYTEKLQ